VIADERSAKAEYQKAWELETNSDPKPMNPKIIRQGFAILQV